ncbi:MAG: hypothetical protein J6A04_00440 [Clostridia bacterium]|nr:hypothetical protein [Clostridia bacterium]
MKETAITREDITRIFGKMTTEETDAKLEEANGIVKQYGIYPEVFLRKARDCKNGEELKGSVYVAKAIKAFCYE